VAQLPKQSRLKRDAGKIFQRADEIVPREKGGSMVRAFNLLAGISDDLEIAARAREEDRPQKRKGL
jgi:hypothetical protein